MRGLPSPALLPRTDPGPGGEGPGRQPGPGVQDREKGHWDLTGEDRIVLRT